MPRATGLGTKCRSGWGAEDMIGNVREYVADWYAEPGWNGATDSWPDGGPGAIYYADSYQHGGTTFDPAWGLSGSHYVDQGFTTARVPAASHRGGGYTDWVSAGVFSMTLAYGPAASPVETGVRCCAGGGR